LKNVHSREVDAGWDQWLEYAQKYQLTYYDPHGSSSTEKRLAGSTWKWRPYALTPFRLMSLNGDIEEIPYPEVIYEYGLKGIGSFIFTPVGLLITPEKSIFLLDNEHLTRIWGQPSGWFYRPESVFSMRISPDGCKVVFVRIIDWAPKTRKPIAILHICQRQQ
jgi:hypothetical protein